MGLIGEGTQVEISVSPTSLDFGAVSLGTPSSLQITVNNTGTGTMLLDAITFNNDMWTTETSNLTINEGENGSFAVIFTPDLAGTWSGVMSISSNDPSTPILEVALAGTGVSNASGEISGTWTQANSPYFIIADVTVPDGETLTIEAGVEVVFDKDYTLKVNGSLTAIGTEEDSIHFHGKNGKPVGRIYFDEAENARFEYCKFENSSNKSYYSGFEEEDGRTSNWTSEGQSRDSFGVSEDAYEGDYSMHIYRDTENNNWYDHYAVSTDLLITGNNLSLIHI